MMFALPIDDVSERPVHCYHSAKCLTALGRACCYDLFVAHSIWPRKRTVWL